MLDFSNRHRLVKKGLASPKIAPPPHAKANSSRRSSTAPREVRASASLLPRACRAHLLATPRSQRSASSSPCSSFSRRSRSSGSITRAPLAKNSRHPRSCSGVCLVHLVIVKLIYITVDNQLAAGRPESSRPPSARRCGSSPSPTPLRRSALGAARANTTAFTPPSSSACGEPSFARTDIAAINPVFLVTSLISGFIAVFVTLKCAAAAGSFARASSSGSPRGCSRSLFGLIGPIHWEVFQAT